VARFETYAFLTADGEFVSTADMGWFGCDNATVEKRQTYKERFDAYLKEAQEQGCSSAFTTFISEGRA
jgi:hypothetical protein